MRLFAAEMLQGYWEDELMYYAKENYISYFLEHMTNSFGIVNMDDRYIRDANFMFQRAHCDCLMELCGPYFKIVAFIEEEVLVLRFRITRFRAWVIVLGRISIS